MSFKSCKFKPDHKFIIIWLSLAAFLHNILMNGANNVIISSLQKEFYLSSKETGIYVSVYDIGSLVSSLVVGFASARGSKPRWISFGMCMLFLGCMITVLPHFIKQSPSQSNVPDAFTSTETSVIESNIPVISENTIELCNYSIDVDNIEHGRIYRPIDLLNNTNNNDVQLKLTVSNSNYLSFLQVKHLLYAANIINGLSSASLTTTTFSYIEDFAPESLSSIYEAIYFATGAFGVGIGFIITSKCLQYHTDIDKGQARPSWLKPSHPNWIGAWWLPFLIFGFMSLIFAFVIFFFPRRTRHKPSVVSTELVSLTNGKAANGHAVNVNGGINNHENNNEEHNLNGRSYDQGLFIETLKQTGSLLSMDKTGIRSSHANLNRVDNHQHQNTTIGSEHHQSKSKDLLKKSISLVQRPVYVFVIILAAIEGLLQNSFLAFAALFLEYQYRLASGSASFILGLLSIPPLIIGGLISGIVVKKLKNKAKSCFIFLAFILFINLFVYLGFMIYCKEPNIIQSSIPGEDELTVADNCNCNMKLFKPVCLRENTSEQRDIFFQSACLAGCTEFNKDSEIYYNCSQVTNSYIRSNSSSSYEAYFENGLCSTGNCNTRLIISYACIFFLMFMNALTFLPYLKATIGCIGSEEMNPIGLGMKQFFMNAFGTIPGPILFGSVIDLTCKYWHTDETNQRVCKMYDNQNFAFYFGLLGVGFKSVCFVLVILSIILLNRQEKKQKLPTITKSNGIDLGANGTH